MNIVITLYCFFFFNDTATTEIYTLSLHDALPICGAPHGDGGDEDRRRDRETPDVAEAEDAPRVKNLRLEDGVGAGGRERSESTRLNSSHANISYAVFCLKKKNNL